VTNDSNFWADLVKLLPHKALYCPLPAHDHLDRLDTIHLLIFVLVTIVRMRASCQRRQSLDVLLRGMVGDVLFWENQIHKDGYNCSNEEGRAQNTEARQSEGSLQKCYLNLHRNRIHETNESGVRALVRKYIRSPVSNDDVSHSKDQS